MLFLSEPLTPATLGPDVYPSAWKLIPDKLSGKLLVAGAELLAVAVDDDGPVRFESQVGATQFVNPGVVKSKFLNFCFSIAQYFPVPEIAGTQDDRFFNTIAGYRN